MNKELSVKDLETVNYFSNENFPFSRGMYINTSNCNLWLQRLSFIGELGWEIYIPIKKTKIIPKRAHIV